MTRSYRLCAFTLKYVAVVFWSLQALGQGPDQLPTLRGTIRDSEGKAVAQASVTLQRNDSRDSFQEKTDAQGNYRFARFPDGVYRLGATKDGYDDALIPSVFFKPSESKVIDLTMRVQLGSKASPGSAPQFSDEPQFTVAGVTDATSLGGHGSDTVVRARNSLAKETVVLGESAGSVPFDATREKSLREAVVRQPADFSANHQLGQLLIATGKAREAIPFLERAAALDPTNSENGYDLALANAQGGNTTVAQAEITKLLAIHEQADLHHLLGDVDEKLGESLEAVHHYQRAAELDPSEPHLFDWGAELLLHHAPQPAGEVFAKGTHLFPLSARMLLGLGAAYFAHGAYDDAILRISQASDLNPNAPLPYKFLGKIEQTQPTPSPELVEKLHRFVTLQPQNPDANYYYALGLWKLRNVAHEATSAAQVESLLETAIRIDPKHAPAIVQLGIVHSDQGSYRKAISDYQKALQADPQLEEAHYRLAQAYRQIGESDKAKEELHLYGRLAKESAQRQDRERREIKQFVYTLRDQPSK